MHTLYAHHLGALAASASPTTGPTPPDRRVPLAGRRAELGITTAELLANAALGVAALVVIWALLSGVGEQVVNTIRDSLN